MKILTGFSSMARLGMCFVAIVLLLTACSGGGSSSGDSGGTVTGVATPSKVSVVNTN